MDRHRPFQRNPFEIRFPKSAISSLTFISLHYLLLLVMLTRRPLLFLLFFFFFLLLFLLFFLLFLLLCQFLLLLLFPLFSIRFIVFRVATFRVRFSRFPFLKFKNLDFTCLTAFLFIIMRKCLLRFQRLAIIYQFLELNFHMYTPIGAKYE